jgi:subtilisin-like proprotein convertase family protein
MNSQKKKHFFWLSIVSTFLLTIIIVFGNFIDNKSDTQITDSSNFINETQFDFSDDGDCLVSSNDRNYFDVQIKNKSFELKSKKKYSSWKAKYELEHIKLNDRKLKFSKNPKVSAKNNAVLENHNNFEIIYTHTQDGLRQDFTIQDGPKDVLDYEIKLKLSTNLIVSKLDKHSIQLTDKENLANKIAYKDLIAYDANNKIIESRMDFKLTNEGYDIFLSGSGENITYPITIDPLSTAIWSYEPVAKDSTLRGSAILSGCDFNDDGNNDIVIGSYGFDRFYFNAGQLDYIQDAGKIEVFYGTGIETSPFNSTPDFEMVGYGSYNLGFSIDCAGDLNGDDIMDLIVGAPAYAYEYSPGEFQVGGAFYILYGGSNGFQNSQIDSITSEPLYNGAEVTYKNQLPAEEAQFQLGASVSGAGDVNGDGYDDLIVGSPNWTPKDALITPTPANNYVGEGAAWLYFGNKIDDYANGTMPEQKYRGEHYKQYFGYTVSGAGDVNNDGFDDILIGTPINSVYTTPDSIEVIKLDSVPVFSGPDPCNPEVIDSFFYDTIMVSTTKENFGYVRLYLGDSGGTSITPNWVKAGHENSKFGYAIDTLGDINNDGATDIVISCPKYTPYFGIQDSTQIELGAVYVFRGIPGSNSGLESEPYSIIMGYGSSTGFGSSISAAGDVDFDGIPDLLIGAPNYSGQYPSQGAVFGYYGNNIISPIDSTFDCLLTGEKSFSYLGSSVSKAGLINSDSAHDVVVGAPGYNVDVENDSILGGGSAYLLYGIEGCGLRTYAKPVFLTFPQDTIVVSNDIGACGAIVNYDLPTVADNCDLYPGALTLEDGKASGQEFPVGETTVTYKVTNSAGDFQERSFVVQVIDLEAPTIDNCPSNIVMYIGPDNTETKIEYPEPTFNDNCGVDQIYRVEGPASGDTISVDVHTVVYKAIDLSGNETSCTFRIVILDTNEGDPDFSILEVKKQITNVFPALEHAGLDSTKLAPITFDSDELLGYGGGAKLGFKLLISLFEGIIGIDIPDWVEQILGAGSSGLNLFFVNIEPKILPSLRVDIGPYYDLQSPEPDTLVIDYNLIVYTAKPASDFFGCRDTISIANYAEPIGQPRMNVNPATPVQEIGMYFKDFIFEWEVGLKASACLGLPLCIPFLGCAGCLGYEVGFDLTGDIFTPVHLLECGYEIPMATACENSFRNDIGPGVLTDCGNSNNLLYQLLNEIDLPIEISDVVSYNQNNDQFIFAPNKALILAGKVPEMDLTFGRLDSNEFQAPFYVGNKIVTIGKDETFFDFRFDAWSFAAYAVPENIRKGLAWSGFLIEPQYITIGPPIPRPNPFPSEPLKPYVFPLIKIDVMDINVHLKSDLTSTYTFDPNILLDSIDLGQPLYWEHELYETNGSIIDTIFKKDTSQFITKIPLDEYVRIEIPDGQTEEMQIINDFSAESYLSVESSNDYSLRSSFNYYEFTGKLFFGATIGPLLSIPDDFFPAIPLGSGQFQNDTSDVITFDIPKDTITLDPDDIPPTVACFDTTVYLNEFGEAFIDMLTALNPDPDSTFDEPEGGTGFVHPFDVFPDTVFCTDYPQTLGYLVCDDDNCNFDTCIFTIFIEDTIRPHLGCVDIVAGIGPYGTYEIQADEIAIGAVDNCRYLEMEVIPPVLYCEDVGIPTEVTVVATDIAGNQNECTVTVTVVDTIPLQLECPYLEAYPVTRHTDAETCTYTSTNDEFKPMLQAPDCESRIFYVLSGATQILKTEAYDKYLNGVEFNMGETLVTYIGEDASGNTVECSFIVIVEDREVPQMECPEPMVISTNEDGQDDYNCQTEYEITHPYPTDNCNIVYYDVTYTDPDGVITKDTLTDKYNAFDLIETRAFALGVTNLSYLAVDTAGLVTECSYDIIVIDDEMPMIECGSVIACTNYEMEEPVDIRPNDVTQIPMVVQNNVNISDINVSGLQLMNPTGDGLRMTLTSPEGTTITLVDNLCSDPQDINVVLDDDTANAVAVAPCGTLVNQDTFQPIELLAAFIGEMSEGEWILSVENSFTESCGLLTGFSLEICGNNEEGINNGIYLEANQNCTYTNYDGSLDPLFYDNCVGSVLTHDLTIAPDMHTLAGVTFEVGENLVTWIVTDAAGNKDSCTINYVVLDTEAPEFINCPTNDYDQDAEPGICGAYVTFSLPLAEDNCSDPVVTQIDDTGLTSGSVFPVGLTILEWKAEDPSGNVTYCKYRIIVNDTQEPEFACVDDVLENTDPWTCSAEVNHIGPTVVGDNCMDNVSIVWQVEYPEGSGEITLGGVVNASGEIFQEGVSQVDYRLVGQPLILLTEITHDIGILNGGMNPLPYTVLTNNDYAEITNLGPASMNVSGMTLERVATGINETFTVPDNTIIPVGETLVVHFGNGSDDLGSLFFNVPCAVDLATSEPAAYILSFKDRILDLVAVNAFDPNGSGTIVPAGFMDWFGDIPDMSGKGGVYRRFSYDNNHAKDWKVAHVCDAISIGALNPELEVMPDNGSILAFQTIAPHVVECGFTVTVIDQELPSCGQFAQHDFTGASNLGVQGSLFGGNVFTSVISVPDDFRVGEVALVDVEGEHPDMSDLHFKLVGPNGHEVSLFQGLCPGSADFDFNIGNDTLPLIDNAPCGPLGQAGWYSSLNDISAVNDGFFGIGSQGDWTLVICDTVAENSGQLNNWQLRLYEIEAYDQEDVVLENDEGDCGAVFTWTHPRLIDNCQEGSVLLKYLSTDETEVPESPGVVQVATEITEYFEVGTTIVRYVLTDASGNVDSCDFSVLVEDTELPYVACPADMIIFLDGGECSTIVCYEPELTSDNCAVVDTSYSIEPCSVFEIGTTTVEMTVYDEAGNAFSCSFDVTVRENVVSDPDMACNDMINLHLDADCEIEITSDMLLEGNDYGCYDDFEITISDMEGNVLPTSPVITIDYLHDTLMYVIEYPATGNNCMGLLYIDKKLIPEIACPPDTSLLCTADPEAIDANGELLTGTIELLSCEGPVQVVYEDEVINNGDCGDPRVHIIRTFYLTNSNDVIVECSQNIYIDPFDHEQITYPDDVVLECHDVTDVPQLIHPENTGYPYLNGQSITINEPLCNLSYAYTDLVYDICADSYEILRTWSVRNRCMDISEDNPQEYIQLIEVLDTEGPQFHECVEHVVMSASPYDCEANGFLPIPMSIEDACSTVDFQAEIFGNGFLYVEGDLNDGSLKVSVTKLDKNSNTFVRYIVTDACGNRNICEFDIEVVDDSPPIAACEQFKQVTLTIGGDARIAAEEFNSGSFDNCNPTWYKVLRNDGGCTLLNGDDNPQIGGNQLYFDDVAFYCCEDLAATEPIMTTLRVYEVDPGPGPVHPGREAPGGDLYGHFADCMTQVQVESKLPPAMACEDMYISCEENFDPYINTNLGLPEISSVCGIYTLDYEDNYSGLGPCGTGTFLRTWFVYENGVQRGACTQTIHVQESIAFDPTTIVFPAETEYDCLIDLEVTGQPTWDENPCNIVTAELVEVDTFRFVDDACYKILRTWAVLDWCVYEQNSGAEDNHDGFKSAGSGKAKLDPNNYVNDGYYKYTETIKVVDTQAPGVYVEAVCLGTETCVTARETFVLSAAAYEEDDDCGGLYDWQYVIHDMTTWEVVQYSFNNLEYQGVNYQGGEKGKASKDELIHRESANLTILPSLAIGKYRVTWTVSDGCGNTTQVYQDVEVSDKKAPTPFLVDIATALMSNCMVEVWAVDLDKGACDGDCLASFDNCSEVLYFTYTPLLPLLDNSWNLDVHGLYYYDPLTGVKSTREKYLYGEALGWDPERKSSVRVFGLDRDGNAPEPSYDVEVFVWDEFSMDESCNDNNYDFAVVHIELNNEGDDCGGQSFATIGGAITEVRTGEEVSNVMVTLDKDHPEYPVVTVADGSYSFDQLAYGDYTLTANKSDDFGNGVSTLDLLLIQRHLLGIKGLDNAYDLIAADANESGSVSAADILALRKLILLVDDELPKGRSWRFIGKGFVFDNSLSPWDEMEQAEAIQETAIGKQTDVDFEGIKLGDLNQTVDLAVGSEQLENRYQGKADLLVDEVYVEEGNLYVPVRVAKAQRTYGLQMALRLPGFDYKGVESGAFKVTDNNFGRRIANYLTVSIDVPKGVDLEADEILFTLHFETQQNGFISHLLSIAKHLTPNECYLNQNFEIHDLGLKFRSSEAKEFVLMQNEPNPFNDRTQIGFILPVKDEVLVEIVDLQGKIIYSEKAVYDAGVNYISISDQEISEAGIYYYKVITTTDRATKKMIFIR